VIGCACDGTEWIQDRNTFSVIGTQDYNKVQTTYGQFFKDHGVTNLGAVGTASSPAPPAPPRTPPVGRAIGHQGRLHQHQFPTGQHQRRADHPGYEGQRGQRPGHGHPDQQHLRHHGVSQAAGREPKGRAPPTGYGGDLLTGGPGAVQAAQGVYYLSGYEPIEMNTPATQGFQNAMKTYAGVTGDPTLAEYIGYVTVDALVQGFESGGPEPHPTVAHQCHARNHVVQRGRPVRVLTPACTGDHTIGWAMDQRGLYEGAGNCLYITQFQGTTFHLVPSEDPLCGQTIPGVTVSAGP
jgi:branched-chain amino acid transport system substrate-binding protein